MTGAGVDGAGAAPDVADRAVATLRRRGLTVATAESLTGGLCGATITAVPGASDVYVGGVIGYATDVKRRLLGVDAPRVVSADAASQMADGVRRLLDADLGLAFTGVAGPDEQEGRPVGTVFVGVAGPGDDEVTVFELLLDGDRAAIRRNAVERALSVVVDRWE